MISTDPHTLASCAAARLGLCVAGLVRAEWPSVLGLWPAGTSHQLQEQDGAEPLTRSALGR